MTGDQVAILTILIGLGIFLLAFIPLMWRR